MIPTTIAPGHWLDEPAAASYARARAAGMSAGITDAGRTRTEQEALYAAYLRGELAATAARPGTSVHELGRALDLPSWPRAWLATHPEHGWRRTLLPSEPWHFEYFPGLDGHRADEEDDMRMLQRNNVNGSVSLIGPGWSLPLGAWSVAAWTRILGRGPQVVTAADYDVAIACLRQGVTAGDQNAADVDEGALAAALAPLLAGRGEVIGDDAVAMLLAAIKAQPAATVAAIKAAL